MEEGAGGGGGGKKKQPTHDLTMSADPAASQFGMHSTQFCPDRFD